MSDDNEYHGHATRDDGTHVALSKEEASEIWNRIEDAEKKRASDMPTTIDAMQVMDDARERLRKLGWREAKYCPKDGSFFAVIQYGSTGIFQAHYMGEWPRGHVYCCDYLSHPDGMLFKDLADLSEDERLRMDECMGRERAANERMIQSLLSQESTQ